MPGDLFDSHTLPLTPLSRAAFRVARPLLEPALQFDALRSVYARACALGTGSFLERTLKTLDISTDVDPVDFTHIPAVGPSIVVSNHPHGILDGVVLGEVIARRRPDVKLVVNHVLRRIPELRDLCFFVDPFRGRHAAQHSRSGLRAARAWLSSGRCLVMFPAGEVAHALNADGMRADSAWSSTVGRLAIATRATVVPAFIAGQNSGLFYAAGRLHPSLRTALLPAELLRKQGRRVAVALGAPIEVTEWPGRQAAQATTLRARETVERLGAMHHSFGTPLSGSEQAERIAREVEQLPASACLVESNGFRVFRAAAAQIPRTLEEIGRLREITYHAVGEGTGRARDVDRFDEYYTHLFAWDDRARRLVGAYRIGHVDTIVRERGISGLYTRQLFGYDERLVSRLGPALELGRSWIRAEYQKQYNALLVLWRGVGRVAVDCGARILIGPVSISARYSDASHTLLKAFLAQNHRHDALAELVSAIRPGATPAPFTREIVLPDSVAEADALIRNLEADGKGVPVLLRQYLKLNARVLGFSVDPDFGDALDALMMVDLTSVDAGILKRYLGKDTAGALTSPPNKHADHSRAA